MSLSFDTVGIMAEGGGGSAQDIHQPSNTVQHICQKILFNIRWEVFEYYSKICQIKNPPRTHLGYTHTQ